MKNIISNLYTAPQQQPMYYAWAYLRCVRR